jgi:hypothetical protein
MNLNANVDLTKLPADARAKLREVLQLVQKNEEDPKK